MVQMQISDGSSSSFAVSQDEGDCAKGDYRILCSSIEKKREEVRRARLQLGIGLHQLGEHHVRKREYHEAMNAFSEALVEKRSGSSFSFDQSSTCTPLQSLSEDLDQRNDSKELSSDKSVKEVLSTLSSMGTVHSLIGEHSEAMKCYSEITTIRSSLPPWQGNANQPCHDVDETDTSGFNEEVNALDDLFSKISFRDYGHEKRTTKSQPIVLSEPSCFQESKDKTGPEQEIETVHCESDAPWKQLNDAVQELKQLLDHCKEIDCIIDERDDVDITNQVAVLKEEYRHNIEQENTGSMREKCLYMSLLVYDKILYIQKQIAASFMHHQEGEDSNRAEQNNDYVETSNNVAATMIVIGGIHYKLSNLDEELHMYKQALSTYKNALGDCHPFVAGTRKNIGMVLAERCDFDGAMEQFELAKDIYTSNHGSCICSDAASAISCMGNVQYRRGDLDVALSLYSKALYIYRTLGEDVGWSEGNVINVTSTLKIIGMAYSKRTDWESAMKCYEEAMELLVSLNMEKTVEAASLFSRMGGVFYRKGQYEKAMSHYENARKVALEAVGTKNHPDIAGILHFIGIVHQKKSRLDKAMACYQECIQIYKSTLGPDNPAKATTTVYIGSIYYSQRRYDEAMASYKEALRLYETSYGKNHPQVDPTMKSIAMIHIKKEEYDEAMEIFQDLLRRKCIILGSYHPDIAYAHKCIGNIHIKRGELGNALRQYKHAYEIYQRTVGEEHKETKAMKNTIASIRQKLMMQQKEDSMKNVDRRGYKRRQISASRYAC